MTSGVVPQPEPARVAAIQGGTGVIGQAVAAEFSARGYEVAILSRLRPEQASQMPGMEATFVACDVRSTADIRAAVGQIGRRFGRIDALVNCAGVNHRRDVFEIDEDEWDDELRTNLTGCFFTCRYGAELMPEGSAIVNVSSIFARHATTSPAYGASKAGLDSVTRSLAKQLLPRGIRVNAVAPGFVDTPMLRARLEDPSAEPLAALVGLGRAAEPAEIATVVGFLASENASYIVGQVISVDGGFRL